MLDVDEEQLPFAT